jgi:hypothetical protein
LGGVRAGRFIPSQGLIGLCRTLPRSWMRGSRPRRIPSGQRWAEQPLAWILRFGVHVIAARAAEDEQLGMRPDLGNRAPPGVGQQAHSVKRRALELVSVGFRSSGVYFLDAGACEELIRPHPVTPAGLAGSVSTLSFPLGFFVDAPPRQARFNLWDLQTCALRIGVFRLASPTVPCVCESVKR